MHEHQPQPPTESAPETPEREPQLRPRIYVASLSDYNAGRLHGAWLDADQDADALREGVTAMLSRSPDPGAEEWAIHDHEQFAGIQVSEYEDLATVSRLAHGLAEHGPAFAGLVSLLGSEETTSEAFVERYRGHWPVRDDYADELLRDLGAEDELERIPAWMRPYLRLDISGFSRDLELAGDIYVTESDGQGGVYVFDALG